MFTIEMLDAYEGDSLWITYGDPGAPKVIAIDAGRKKTYRSLLEKIKAHGAPLELFVMTHVDDDHILGAVPLLADAHVTADTFRDVWYNGYTHMDPDVAMRPAHDTLGPKNGEIFAGLLLQGRHSWNEATVGATIVVPDDGPLPVRDVAGMRLTLLSPTWANLEAMKSFWERELEDADMEPDDPEGALAIFAERPDLQPDVLGGSTLEEIDVENLVAQSEQSDTKAPNGSSIAFLAEFGGKAVLFTGDAHPPVLEASIRRLIVERSEERLRLDAFKVSHHGSKNNTSTALLGLIDCRRYLISTNGSRHGHPDPACIARILRANVAQTEPTQLFFSHRSDQTEPWDDQDRMADWNYEAIYPPAGRVVDLR